MTQEGFEGYILASTGKVLGKDYAIVAGTRLPYKQEGYFMSAVCADGYYIISKGKELQVKSRDPNIYMQQIVDFLRNAPID